jgi:hypothetical protein
MVFITLCLKSARFDVLMRSIYLGLLAFVMLGFNPAQAVPVALSQLKVQRVDDGLYLTASVQFELPLVVEDALAKGIPLFFVVEADIYRDRWYWTDRRVASATRTIRLAFQPLTRRWRVNVTPGLISNSAGLRATFNQHYETLAEAMSAVQHMARWRIADTTEVEGDSSYKLEFRYRLDLSQLPRPFQIGVAGQKDWAIVVDATAPLLIELSSSEAEQPAVAASLPSETSGRPPL